MKSFCPTCNRDTRHRKLLCLDHCSILKHQRLLIKRRETARRRRQELKQLALDEAAWRAKRIVKGKRIIRKRIAPPGQPGNILCDRCWKPVEQVDLTYGTITGRLTSSITRGLVDFITPPPDQHLLTVETMGIRSFPSSPTKVRVCRDCVPFLDAIKETPTDYGYSDPVGARGEGHVGYRTNYRAYRGRPIPYAK